MKKPYKNLIKILVLVVIVSTSTVFANTYEAPNVIIGPASSEPNAVIIDEKNYTMEELMKTMTYNDSMKMIAYVSEYRKGTKEVEDLLIELISKYNGSDAKAITGYILQDKHIKLLGGFYIDHNTNNLLYVKMQNVTLDENPDITNFGNDLWKKMRASIPNDFYDNIDYLYLELNKGYENAISICEINEEAKKWAMYVDISLLADTNGDELIKNFIYATVYYYILRNDQIDFENKKNENYSYWNHYYKDDSYINQFYKKFWKGRFKEINLGQKKQYPNDFFDNKASKTVYDDMAVSFFNYIFKGVINVNSSKLYYQKNNFFDNYDIFKALTTFFRVKNGIIVR